MVIINVAVTLALLIHASSIVAVDLGAPIVGCSAVDCPTANNLTSADCRIADRKTTSLVGLANFRPSFRDDDFTWTETVQLYPAVSNQDPDSLFERSFYLGLPKGFDLAANATSSDVGACALFFLGVFNTVKFNQDPIGISNGTCDDALTGDCVEALLAQATNAVDSAGNSSTCERLQSHFRSSRPSQCPNFSAEDITVQDLTGTQAPKPFTTAENSTSNCYPTLPKTNSLTPVAAFNASTSRIDSELQLNLLRITPILTIFFPNNGTGNATLQRPESQLTCVKPIDETDAALATKSGTDENKTGGAVMVSSKLGLVGVAMVFSFLILA